MNKTSGFTLMELMVTIAIVAIVSAIAVPNFLSWVPKFQLGGASRDILDALQGTRVQAVKDNTNYTLQFNLGNESFVAFLDDGAGTPDTTPADGIPDGMGDGILDATETIISQKTMPDGINIAATTLAGNQVIFDNQGVASNAGTITITNAQGDSRRIVLELAGSSRIQN
jgi:type IV fimbrial biogenesis protein FimT